MNNLFLSVWGLMVSTSVAFANPAVDKVKLQKLEGFLIGMNFPTLTAAVALTGQKRVESVRQETEAFLRKEILNGTFPFDIDEQFISDSDKQLILRSRKLVRLDAYNDSGVSVGHIYYSPHDDSGLMHPDSSFTVFSVVKQSKPIKDGSYAFDEYQAWWREAAKGRKDGFEWHLVDGNKPSSGGNWPVR